MRHAKPLLLAATLAVGPGLPAADLDPELQEVMQRARALVSQGRTAAAEDLVEGMTGIRPSDPRTWLVVGNLRWKLEAREDAREAYHRAAELGTAPFRAALRERLRAAGLPGFPDRVVHDGWEPFRSLAAHMECWERRFEYSHPTKSCPLDGAAFVRGGLGCPNHPGEGAPPAGEHRISEALLRRGLADETPWVREWATRLAPAELLRGTTLRAYMGERDPTVRDALLERLFARAGHLAEDPLARRLLFGFTLSEDFDVRLKAWTLLHLEGRTPDLSAEDFERLVYLADRGRASGHLTRACYERSPSELRGALLNLLGAPRYGGRSLALQLLVLHGGRADALAAAEALREPGNTALAEQLAWGRHLMARLGERRGLELGSAPEDWIPALEQAEDW